MRRALPLALFLLLGTAFVGRALAGDAPATPKPLPKGLAIGDAVPSFALTGLDGKVFSLDSARKITPEDALAAVQAAAKAVGGADDAKAADPIDKLSGLLQDGAVDAAKRVAFVQAAGHPYGLIATAASTKDMKTLGDVVAWVQKAAMAPIVFLCWSSGCPTCQLYEERLNEIFSTSGARLYLLASNYNDDTDAMKGRLEGDNLGWHVLLDRDAKVADLFGGRRTPHTFVLDDKSVLRYAGAVDSDAAGTEGAEKRANWLQDAIVAVADGRGVDVLQTAPKG